MKKKQILFVHSGGPQGPAQGSSPLLGYLQDALVDCRLIHPSLPDPDQPEYASWQSVLHGALSVVDHGVVLIGHSLGGSVLLKYLSEERKLPRIGGICLIGTPYWGMPGWEVDEYMLADDFARKLPPIPRTYLYHSRNDEVVPVEHMRRYRREMPHALARELEEGGHLFVHGLPQLVRDVLGLHLYVS
ncbi:alpha/beta fold hydrolase [Chitinophaga lutea]